MDVSYDRGGRVAPGDPEALAPAHERAVDHGRSREEPQPPRRLAPVDARPQLLPQQRPRPFGPPEDGRLGRADAPSPLQRDPSQPRQLKTVKPQAPVLYPPTTEQPSTWSTSSSAARDVKRQRLGSDVGEATAKATVRHESVSPSSSAKKDEAFRRSADGASRDLLSFASGRGSSSAGATRTTPTPPPSSRGPPSRFASGSSGAAKSIPPLSDQAPRKFGGNQPAPLPPSSSWLPAVTSPVPSSTAGVAGPSVSARRSPDQSPQGKGGGVEPLKASPSSRRMPRARSQEVLRGDPPPLRGPAADVAPVGSGLPADGGGRGAAALSPSLAARGSAAQSPLPAERGSAVLSPSLAGRGAATQPSLAGRGGSSRGKSPARAEASADRQAGVHSPVQVESKAHSQLPWPAGRFPPPPPRLRGGAMPSGSSLPQLTNKASAADAVGESGGGGASAGAASTHGPRDKPKGRGPRLALPGELSSKPEGEADGSARGSARREVDDAEDVSPHDKERDSSGRRGLKPFASSTTGVDAEPARGGRPRLVEPIHESGSDDCVDEPRGTVDGHDSDRKRRSGDGSDSDGGGERGVPVGSLSSRAARPVSTLARFGRRIITPVVGGGEDGGSQRFTRAPGVSGSGGGGSGSSSHGGSGRAAGRSGGADRDGGSVVTSPRRDAGADSDYDDDRGRGVTAGSDAGSAGERSAEVADGNRPVLRTGGPRSSRGYDEADSPPPSFGGTADKAGDGDGSGGGAADSGDGHGGTAASAAVKSPAQPSGSHSSLSDDRAPRPRKQVLSPPASRLHSNPADAEPRPRKRMVSPPPPRFQGGGGSRFGGPVGTLPPPPRAAPPAEPRRAAGKGGGGGSSSGGSGNGGSPRAAARASPVAGGHSSDGDGDRSAVRGSGGSGRPSSGSAGSHGSGTERRTEVAAKRATRMDDDESSSPVKNASPSSPANA